MASSPVSLNLNQFVNPRLVYLLETLGLSHDPFDGPVAEQELHSSEKEPHFFFYYTDPQSSSRKKPVLQALREAHTGLVFGEPGSGKTTLRYTLESECRAVYDRTLVVSYELSHKLAQPPAAAEHWTNLATELAIDLFIQIVEQLDTFDSPTPVQKQQLRAQIALAWPRLRRTINLILNDDFSDRESGLAMLWPRLNRPAVRHVSHSPKVIDLIKACLPDKKESRPLTSGVNLLKAGIAAAKAWGFQRIYVLVDGVDAHEREVEKMLAIINPLLDDLAKWQAEGLFFYFFLTSEMQTPLKQDYREMLNSLPYPPIWYIIEWDQTGLKKLLRQRLQAAGSRIPGFNALAVSELDGCLEDYLVETARNSPRRLLRAVSALIDAHAQIEPDQLLITSADWRRMRQTWSYGHPVPPGLATNGCPP